MNPISITFKGTLVSKKNRKAPRPGGRGLYLEPRTQEAIERWELQVPGHVRDLSLESPEVEWFFTFKNDTPSVGGCRRPYAVYTHLLVHRLEKLKWFTATI